jgi:hypothetical protein
MFTNNPFGGLNSADYASLAQLDMTKYAGKYKTEIPTDQPNTFAFQGKQPSTKGAAVFQDARGGVHALPSGLFLVTGGTGVGKSITCAALAAAVAGINEPTYVTPDGDVTVGKSIAAYMYVFEARGPELTLSPGKLLPALEKLAPIVVEGKPFDEKKLSADERALATLTGTDSFFNSLRDATNKFGRRLLIIDSVSLALRQYASDASGDKGRAGEPTMPGGLQPSDVDFCVRLNSLAARCGFTVLGLVNNDLVPFASKLEGIIEGEVNILGPGYFSFRQRSTRTRTVVNLPAAAMTKGREFMRYAVRTGGGLLSMSSAPDLGQMDV